MNAQLHIPLGTKKLVLEGDGTPQGIMKALGFWSQLPDKCGACGSKSISLMHRQPKGYDYYGLSCDACHATINFGQAKVGGAFFIRYDEKWEKYSQKESNNQDSEPKQVREEEVPF